MNSRLLARRDAAQYLGISLNHFLRHVAPDISPVPGFGRRVLFDRIDLDRLVDGKKGIADQGWVERCNFE